MNLSDVGNLEHYTARFWEKVDKSGNCWLWTKAGNGDGYGRMLVQARGKAWRARAHRLSYLFAHGELPDDLEVCHGCDNPQCVRPEHLFLGTQADNVRDMLTKNRQRLTLGLKGERCRQAKLSAQNVIAASERYMAGETATEIARAFGVTQATIWNLLKGHTYKTVPRPMVQMRPLGHRPGIQDGSKNRRAKVTEEDVREMRQRHASGESAVSLGRAYGLSPSHSWLIVSRKQWRHVE